MHERVLAVRRLADFELAVLDRQPAPARSELRLARFDEIVAELVVTAEVAVDERKHRARYLLAAAALLHPRPEMDVVEILGGVVEHAGVLAEARLDDLLEPLTLEAGARQKLVQIVHIGFVVLVMVKLERLGRHVRLERFVWVRQGGKFEGHGDYSQKFAQGKVRRKLMVPLGRGKPSARAGANHAKNPIWRGGRGAPEPRARCRGRFAYISTGT